MTIHFQTTGSGEPVIIFVHGYGCALSDWDAQVAHLSSRFRCVALDLPGHGSSPLPQAQAMSALTDAVNQVKAQAGTAPVILVGHSLGTRLITDAYLQAPDRVIGLVFVDGRYYEGPPDAMVQRMAALVDGPDGFRGFMQRAFSGMFTAHSDPVLRDRVTHRALEMNPQFGRAILLESVLWDASQGLQKIRDISVPVLLLQSTDIDAERRLISMRAGLRTRYMDVVSELVADADVKIVTGIGHFASLEAPEIVSREIEAFVDLVSKRGRPQQALRTSA
jgi:pimeloyl-ACP methyl ester carboxylesterase